MKVAPNFRLEQHRVEGPANTNYGAFRFGSLTVIVAAGGGWDHVSVSRQDRTPTWEDMDRMKRIVFRDDEVVMQLHVNDDRKINRCTYCLHLWRPQTADEIVRERAAWMASGEA